jgi:hypothetical protein
MGEVGAKHGRGTTGVTPPTETGRGERTPEVFHLLAATENAITALEAKFGALDARPPKESQP